MCILFVGETWDTYSDELCCSMKKSSNNVATNLSHVPITYFRYEYDEAAHDQFGFAHWPQGKGAPPERVCKMAEGAEKGYSHQLYSIHMHSLPHQYLYRWHQEKFR